MNGFKSEKISNTPEYELTFYTTSYDEYKKVCDFCQKLIDERENNNLIEILENDNNKKLLEIKQIIKDHDEDSMPEDFFYIDKIREVINK